MLMIYFDNAASTKPSKNVIDKLNEVVNIYGNPSSQHDYGRAAKHLIKKSFDVLYEKIGANKDDTLLFTSGATMSNSLFIQGYLNRHPGTALVISAIEHNDIMLLAKYLMNKGVDVYTIPVLPSGHINTDILENTLYSLKYKHEKFLCSIQMANGECGTIQNIGIISKIVHMYGGVLHTDATQYVPYYPIDLSNIDAFSMSGQKIECIKGTGLLYIKRGIEIDPLIFGEQGLIGGTENSLGIACLSVAYNDLKYDNKKMIQLQSAMIHNLLPYGNILGTTLEGQRLPNNIYISFFKRPFDSTVALLNEWGIAASAGSACSQGNLSHVVAALGYGEEVAKGAVRFSLSKDITEKEIDKAIEAVKIVMK